MKRIVPLTLAAVLLIPFQSATAASRMSGADVNRLTTYAVALGRASACGINVSVPGKRVGAWLNRITGPGAEQDAMNLVFMSGIIKSRDAQTAGRSPDSCAAVVRSFSRYEWP